MKGPNYNVADRFSFEKDPEWKIGTTPRNTLDTKAKYEHYFRKDIDVKMCLCSLISMKPIEESDSSQEILALVEMQEYIKCDLVPTRSEEVQDDSRP